MRRTIAWFLVLLLVTTPALATSWVTNSFRTPSGGLVQPGDTMAEVLESAGEPQHQRIISKGITLGPVAGLTREQWTYRGTDGLYVITFAGDQVVQIRVIPNR